MKKIVSIFLIVAMVLSLLSVSTVFAAPGTTPAEVYTELIRIDFDDMATAALTTDQTAFNAAYGSNAKLLSKAAANLNYAIVEKAAGGSDKYIDLKQQNGNSTAAIQITLPDSGIKANNGTYKLSFDAMVDSATYVPFLRVKTSHVPDPAAADSGNTGGILDWGPCLAAIAPLDESTGLANTSSKNLSGTYSTWDYTNGAENKWDVSASLANNKAALTFSQWTKVDIKIDTINKKAHYYFNGLYIGSQEGNTFGEKYICGTGENAMNAKHIQIQSVQPYQSWYGYKLDNITFSHSESAVVNPEAPINTATAYNEVYRLDFDKLEEKALFTDEETPNTTAFDAAYSGIATILNADGTYNYGVSKKSADSNDMYLMLSQTKLGSAHSKAVTMRMHLPEAARPVMDTGLYKISYDVMLTSGDQNQRPFLQLKTYHGDPATVNDWWGPTLSAFGPLNENNSKNWNTDATVYGTYSAHPGYGSTISMESGTWFPNVIGEKTPLEMGEWHNVEIVIDTTNDRADYYYDGIYTGSQKDETLAKRYLYDADKANMRMKMMAFVMFQGYQSKGVMLDNITVAKQTSAIKTEGFENISAIDLSADSKKLTFAASGNVGKVTDVVVVDGSTGKKLDIATSSVANEVTVDFANALAANGVYKVYIVGENTYTTGKIILGTGATEVAETRAELLKLDVVDNNGEELVAGDTVTANAVLRNGTGTIQSAYIILATYNNGLLTNVDFKPISSAKEIFKDSLDLTITNGENVKVSAFVWNDLVNILPLGAADSIN